MRAGRQEILKVRGPYILGLAAIMILAFAVETAAQGSDGRSETAVRTTVPVQGARHVRRAPVSVRRALPASGVSGAFKSGRLDVVVNESGSELLIFSDGSPGETEFNRTTLSSPSLISHIFPAGSYKVLVRKDGFFDESRTVEVVGKKRRKLIVNLRPKMSVLTVNTNLEDAAIDIENVGKFNGSLRKHFVEPGVFRIRVERRGYIPQTATVDLTLPGREQNINLVLQPLPIDSVLERANENISRGNYADAAELANDVLLLNASHAKANLLYGLVQFHRGEPGAASYFSRAIRNGETVVLPIKLRDERAGDGLVGAELHLHRDGLSIRTSERFDLNLTLKRPNIYEFGRSKDRAIAAHIVLKGKSDFYGRPIEPRLMIYSSLSAARGEPVTLICLPTATARTCSTDVDVIYELISNWRDSDDNDQTTRSIGSVTHVPL
jgi:hypothetical protein